MPSELPTSGEGPKDLTLQFLHTGLCSACYSQVSFDNNLNGSITFEHSNCCDSCVGESRRVASAFDVSSYLVQATVCLLCCKSARLKVVSGGQGLATASDLTHADHLSVLQTLQATLRSARKEPETVSPPRNFARGGVLNCHTFKDCTIRSTEWRMGPGSSVVVALTESWACMPRCFNRVSVEGAALQQVRSTQAYSPIGVFACKQTPSGRCSCDEYIALGLSDGVSLYGGAAKGDAKMILDELSLRKRELEGAEQERTSFVLNGTDMFSDCFGAECELRVTVRQPMALHPCRAPL